AMRGMAVGAWWLWLWWGGGEGAAKNATPSANVNATAPRKDRFRFSFMVGTSERPARLQDLNAMILPRVPASRGNADGLCPLKKPLKTKEASARASLLVFPCVVTSLPHCVRSLAVAALCVTHAAHAVLHSPQAAPKTFGKLVPCAPQPRLQRILRHAQRLRRFPRRIALHFTQDKR